jgi:hypothetical protein
MSFSPSQTALEGFRLVRRRPASFVVWALFGGLIVEAFVAAVMYAYGDMFAFTGDWASRAQPPDPASIQAILQAFGRMALLLTAGSLLLIVVMAALLAAIYRAVLAPGSKAFAYLRLGGAELRLIAFQILLMVLLWTCELSLIGVIIGVATTSLLVEAKIAIGLAAGIAVVALAVFLLVRLSLAGPTIVARERMDIGAAWRMTRGRFWPLLWTGLLAYALAIAVSMVANVFIQPIMFAVMPQFGGVLPGSDPLAGWRYAMDNRVLFGAFALLAMPAFALQLVVQSAPFAAAYRELSEAS